MKYQPLSGCDLSGLPEEIAYHPPNKQVLGVGETVIMFCVKKPSNPKAVTCQADKLITPVGKYQFVLNQYLDRINIIGLNQ